MWNTSLKQSKCPAQFENVLQGTDGGEKLIYNYLNRNPNSTLIFPLYCTWNVMLIKKFCVCGEVIA